MKLLQLCGCNISNLCVDELKTISNIRKTFIGNLNSFLLLQQFFNLLCQVVYLCIAKHNLALFVYKEEGGD